MRSSSAASAGPSFAGQVALVTGATSGIGLELARALAAAGATVIGTGRDQGRLMQLQAEVDLALTLDLTDDKSVAACAAVIEDRHGAVDLLVHNAGIGRFETFEDTRLQDVQAVMDTNLYGPIRLTQALLPAMKARGSGVVCSIASVAGERGYPKHTAYCASKHALIGWSRALGKDLRGTGVDVVIVCPPAVDTPFFSNAGFPDYKEKHPGLTLMSPRDVALQTLQAIAARKGQVILSPRAKALYLLDKLAPPVVERLQRWKDSR